MTAGWGEIEREREREREREKASNVRWKGGNEFSFPHFSDLVIFFKIKNKQ
jgi:hypothetical protein